MAGKRNWAEVGSGYPAHLRSDRQRTGISADRVPARKFSLPRTVFSVACRGWSIGLELLRSPLCSLYLWLFKSQIRKDLEVPMWRHSVPRWNRRTLVRVRRINPSGLLEATTYRVISMAPSVQGPSEQRLSATRSKLANRERPFDSRKTKSMGSHRQDQPKGDCGPRTGRFGDKQGDD